MYLPTPGRHIPPFFSFLGGRCGALSEPRLLSTQCRVTRQCTYEPCSIITITAGISQYNPIQSAKYCNLIGWSRATELDYIVKCPQCIWQTPKKKLILCHVTSDMPVTLVTPGKPRKFKIQVQSSKSPVAVWGLNVKDLLVPTVY